mmetsp:Transcript_22560/g.31415  ORF Transcript_22560/g.31415 Transcript_22560/m.31415 type:complete len:222 (+) Transcript_22560:57-722(+)
MKRVGDQPPSQTNTKKFLTMLHTAKEISLEKPQIGNNNTKERALVTKRRRLLNQQAQSSTGNIKMMIALFNWWIAQELKPKECMEEEDFRTEVINKSDKCTKRDKVGKTNHNKFKKEDNYQRQNKISTEIGTTALHKVNKIFQPERRNHLSKSSQIGKKSKPSNFQLSTKHLEKKLKHKTLPLLAFLNTTTRLTIAFLQEERNLWKEPIEPSLTSALLMIL